MVPAPLRSWQAIQAGEAHSLGAIRSKERRGNLQAPRNHDMRQHSVQRSHLLTLQHRSPSKISCSENQRIQQQNLQSHEMQATMKLLSEETIQCPKCTAHVQKLAGSGEPGNSLTYICGVDIFWHDPDSKLGKVESAPMLDSFVDGRWIGKNPEHAPGTPTFRGCHLDCCKDDQTQFGENEVKK